MLISEQTSIALDELVGVFFDLNRTTDRMISVMQNEWCMPKAVSIIHPNIAHVYPLLSDKITEIKDRYNLSSVYPVTHQDDRNYTNLQDMFGTLLKENEDAYQEIKLVDKIAVENGDFMVQADLVEFMQKFNVLFSQIVTLNDKAIQMPTDYDIFDQHISEWGIDGIDLS